MHLSPLVAQAADLSKAVVLLLSISLFVGVLCLSLFCYALLCVHSSFAIILKRKRKLVALLLLSYRCIVTINVLWLFLTVPWVGMQCVIVVFPDHTHLLFDNLNLLPPKPKFTFKQLKKGVQEFHRKFMLTPADKAAYNAVKEKCRCGSRISGKGFIY